MVDKPHSAGKIEGLVTMELSSSASSQLRDAGVVRIKAVGKGIDSLLITYAVESIDQEVRAAVSRIFATEYPRFPLEKLHFMGEQFQGKSKGKPATRHSKHRVPPKYSARG